jgi:hypothetical protein
MVPFGPHSTWTSARQLLVAAFRTNNVEEQCRKVGGV